MQPFRYERATDVGGAVTAIGGGAKVLAGGTNLVDLMRLGVERPSLVVDVSRLPLDTIDAAPDGSLRIGANVRNSDLAADRRVRTRYPMLAQALLSGASGQLRNMVTTGGNLLQRTRCPYFQDVTKPCNKREPGTGCPARKGEHHNLAILGHSEHCVATHPSDMAVALAALDAVVRVTGPAGEREIPLVDFHRLPEDAPQHDTVLQASELVTAVDVPALAFALVSVAAAIETGDDGNVADCRIAYGGIAHKPWRAKRAEEALRGGPATADAFGAAADAELHDAAPLRDNGFKLLLARNLLVRVLTDLAEA